MNNKVNPKQETQLWNGELETGKSPFVTDKQQTTLTIYLRLPGCNLI